MVPTTIEEAAGEELAKNQANRGRKIGGQQHQNQQHTIEPETTTIAAGTTADHGSSATVEKLSSLNEEAQKRWPDRWTTQVVKTSGLISFPVFRPPLPRSSPPNSSGSLPAPPVTVNQTTASGHHHHQPSISTSAIGGGGSGSGSSSSRLNKQQPQQNSGRTTEQQQWATGNSSSSNYISLLVNKSSILLHTLRQRYTSLTMQQHSTTDNNNNPQQPQPQHQLSRDSSDTQTTSASQSSQASSSEPTTATTTTTATTKRDTVSHEYCQLSDSSCSSGTSAGTGSGNSSSLANRQQQHQQPPPLTTPTRSANRPPRPPLPPPPPREVVEAASSCANVLVAANRQQQQHHHHLSGNQLSAGTNTSTGTGGDLTAQPLATSRSLGANSLASPTGSVAGARRHALQEQSLERDAALSLKVRELKHKRAHSIKSALRHAHFGSSRSSGEKTKSSEKGGSSSAGDGQVKSMPYELFEPPVTQRTFQRSKRRGAMMSADAKRQMSVDTIGLRQLTDEYLHNAGVKPMSSSGQCSLVTLTTPPGGGSGGAGISAGSPMSCGGGGGFGGGGGKPTQAAGGKREPTVGIYASSSGSTSSQQQQQPQCSIEAQLYQASKHVIGFVAGGTNQSGSEDSLSNVTILPGNLPWQSDVSIQCEILQAPPTIEPYETTGDILNTIAGPFRGSALGLAMASGGGGGGSGSGSSNIAGGSLDNGGGANQLSATLKRGLTAISQHHLSPAGAPSAALNVVGSLKKSLSNTLDISCLASNARTTANVAAAVHHLQSQDSLPAYSSLLNEPESPTDQEAAEINQRGRATNQQNSNNNSGSSYSYNYSTCGGGSGLTLDPEGGGLIGQLASKLTRQSSKKFSVSKKGLQRALSFDCRGYKRLDSSESQQQQRAGGGAGSTSCGKGHDITGGGSANSRNLLSAKHRAHNKSTLGLNVDQSPRPYLPQSASQVDFQLPLLPYHKMQEAIVSQRLLEPPPTTAAAAAANAAAADDDNSTSCAEDKQQQQQLNADELLCAQPSTAADLASFNIVEPQRLQDSKMICAERGEQPSSGSGSNSNEHGPTSSQSLMRKATPPRLVLDIPNDTTCASISSGSGGSSTTTTTTTTASTNRHHQPQPTIQYDYDDGGEEVCAVDQDDANKGTVIVCLPSPNISIDPAFNALSNSLSFCIDPQNNSARNTNYNNHNNDPMSSSGINNQDDNNNRDTNSNTMKQLTASDIFAHSKNLIKRPSTMMVSDAMNQVAQALNSTSSSSASAKQLQLAAKQQQAPTSVNRVSVVLRNRRQAIVPPKLVTDANNSDNDSDMNVGQLVDVDGDDDDDNNNNNNHQTSSSEEQRLGTEEATVRALRRKRSGGGDKGATEQQFRDDRCKQLATAQERISICGTGSTTNARRLSGSQTTLPTFYIEPDRPSIEVGISEPSSRQTPDTVDQYQRRPDSQMTNVDSLVSSGSSASLSIAGKRDFTVTSPGGLTVSFGSSRGRRRSSIAVIPQMQICPGDLLVYSKQLIDRMNQSDENEPPPFLTIDDKKGKNIWSSLKFFDNRTLKARNELLCSLEDVLSSLQPSTFVDEQLSHYKGMLWNEFLYETESRRSASSEGLSVVNDTGPENDKDCQIKQVQVQISAPAPVPTAAGPTAAIALSSSHSREGVKATLSSGTTPSSQTTSTTLVHRSRDPTVRSISSRFREKPKLKRGQTVDSVFRIPLIPSSPLKHAQQHQQTPTAHLEEHDLNTIEDDERSSPSVTSRASSRDNTNTVCRQNRSHSTRSRSGSNHQANNGNNNNTNLGTSGTDRQIKAPTPNNADHDSSFETDDAIDLIGGGGGGSSSQVPGGDTTRTPHQMVRQSSLSTLSSTITRTEQKRQRALWDLFQSECAFFFDHLMTLKNVYMEPLKKIQVEGFAMFADPDVLFGNLDELCCGVYDFCKEFLYIIMRTLKTRPEELNATDVLIKLYKKNPKIDHLRGVYHRYTLNYINALTYLESLRRQVEFVEFEKWSSRDVRCKKLQLTDLLVAPVQHIMRVPIILKDIESHTENPRDRDEIRAILAVEEASLRELDDKMRWLKNFERLLEIQKNISWPSVIELDPKLFIPDFLKEVLSKQPCEKLIVSPRRQIVHEGTLSNLDLGKACDMHVILFDDMLLLTRRKKGLTKKASTVCKTNSGGSSSTKDDGSFKYLVYKQPLSLDRFYVHDIQQVDSQAIGMKHLFLLIVMNRFQQIINVHSFSAPNDDVKQTWLFKIKKTSERWKKNYSNNPGDQPQSQQQQEQSIQPVASSSTTNDLNTQGSTSGQQQHHHQHHNQQQQQHQRRQDAPAAVNKQQATDLSSSSAASSARQVVIGGGDQPKSYMSAAYKRPVEQANNLDATGGSRAASSGGSRTTSASGQAQAGYEQANYDRVAPIEFIVTSASGNSRENNPNYPTASAH